jgi:hypothetical protein
MPASGECLRRIAPAAAMVNGFVETTLNTNKTQCLGLVQFLQLAAKEHNNG